MTIDELRRLVTKLQEEAADHSGDVTVAATDLTRAVGGVVTQLQRLSDRLDVVADRLDVLERSRSKRH